MASAPKPPPLPKKETAPAVPSAKSTSKPPPLPGGSKKKARDEKKKKKEEGFFGINLPKLPFGGPDLPALGITTDKKNPLTQVEDLVTGLPKGLLTVGKEAADYLILDTAKEVLTKGLGDHDEQGPSMDLLPDPEQYPLLNAGARSFGKTAKSLNPQDLVDVARGNPEDTAFGKRVHEEGWLGAGLATVADLATLAGGTGLALKGAGAGRLAEASRLIDNAEAAAHHGGAPKGSTAAQLDDLAVAAEKVGDLTKAGELRHAAAKMGEAEKLLAQGPGTTAEKAANLARTFSTGGAKIAGSPAQVYVGLGKGLAKVPGVKQGAAATARGARRLTETDLGKKLHLDSTGRTLRQEWDREVRRPLESEAYKTSEIAQKVRNTLKDATSEDALTYLHTGEGRKVLVASEHLSDEQFVAWARREFGEDVNVQSVAKAADYELGKLPADEVARIDEALRIQQDEWYGPYEDNWFLSGRGDDLTPAGLAERAEQTLDGPMPTTVARLTEEAQAPIRKKIADLTEQRNAIVEDLANLRAHLAQGGDEIPLSAAQRASLGQKAGKVKELEAQLAREQTRLDQTTATGAADIERVFTAGDRRLERAVNRGDMEIGRAELADDARTGQLMGQGRESRAKQAALRQRRLNKGAAVANATGKAEAKGAAKVADVRAEGAEGATTAAFDATQKSLNRQVRKQEKVLGNTAKRLESAKKAERTAAENATRTAGEREVRKLNTKIERTERAIAGKEYDLHGAADRARSDINALPKKDRVRVRSAERAVTALEKMAEEAEALVPGSGENFVAMMQEISTGTADDIIGRYVHGGRASVETGQGPRGLTPKSRRLRVRRQTERHGTGESVPRTLAGQVEVHGKKVGQKLVNDFAGHIQGKAGSGTAREVLLAAGHTADELEAMSGKQIRTALAESTDAKGTKNLTAWDPYGKPTGTDGRGRPLSDDAVTLDSPVIATHMFEHFGAYSAASQGLGNHILTNWVDPSTRAWKHAVLALSPRWHTGNMIGNIGMATLVGGLTPMELMHHGREAVKLLRSRDAKLTPVLERGGSYFDESAHLVNKPGLKGVPAKVIRKSYDWNQAVDNWHKSTVYLAKKAKGYSDQTAVELALRSAGDFKKMSVFEQNVMRRVMPFYAWQKHITKAAFRLPVENPMRVAWTLHLADSADRAYPDPGGDEPFQEMSIPNPFAAIGLGKPGDRISLRGAGPLGTAMVMNPTNRTLGYSLNPLIKAGSILGFGIDPGKGFGPVTSADSEFGEGSKFGFGIQEPAAAIRTLSQMIPQTRQVQDAVAGQMQARYSTGEPIEGKESEREMLEMLARFLGIPFPETPDPPKTLSKGGRGKGSRGKGSR